MMLVSNATGVYSRWIITRPSVTTPCVWWPNDAANQTTSSVTDTILWSGNDSYRTPATGDYWIIGNANRVYYAPEPVIHRPAVIRRRSAIEEARAIIRDVDRVRDASEVKRRARRLLLSHLTPEQRETLIGRGWFIVEGGKSKQRYRIRDKSYAGNIDVLDGERITARLCCHAGPEIPVHDHLLAQKIMLEVAEDDFLKLANRTAVA